MIDPDFTLALENPAWVQVLRAYHLAQQEVGQPTSIAVHHEVPAVESSDTVDEQSPEADSEDGPKQRRAARWLSRIHQVEGLAKEELSRIHGRLIAYGFLKCDLADRSAEVVYQLTLAGKQVLTHAALLVTGELADIEEESVAAA